MIHSLTMHLECYGRLTGIRGAFACKELMAFNADFRVRIFDVRCVTVADIPDCRCLGVYKDAFILAYPHRITKWQEGVETEVFQTDSKHSYVTELGVYVIDLRSRTLNVISVSDQIQYPMPDNTRIFAVNNAGEVLVSTPTGGFLFKKDTFTRVYLLESSLPTAIFPLTSAFLWLTSTGRDYVINDLGRYNSIRVDGIVVDAKGDYRKVYVRDCESRLKYGPHMHYNVSCVGGDKVVYVGHVDGRISEALEQPLKIFSSPVVGISETSIGIIAWSDKEFILLRG